MEAPGLAYPVCLHKDVDLSEGQVSILGVGADAPLSTACADLRRLYTSAWRRAVRSCRSTNAASRFCWTAAVSPFERAAASAACTRACNSAASLCRRPHLHVSHADLRVMELVTDTRVVQPAVS